MVAGGESGSGFRESPFEARLVTSRQRVAHMLATGAMWLVFGAAGLMSWNNFQNEDYPEVAAWVYVDSPLVPGGWYGFPPLALWVGIGMFIFSAVDVRIDEIAAIRRARGQKVGILRGPERQRTRDARENLKCQLRARGHAGLFASGRGINVRLGLGIVGVGMVLVTSLFTPTTITIEGVAIEGIQKGLLPVMCLVASVVALVGLLFCVPHGRSVLVVVDSSGNLSSVDQPAVPR